MREDDGFDGAIKLLTEIELGLGSARDFFAPNAERYLSVCQRAAVQVLLANRPDSLDDDVWRENVMEFVEMVTSAAFDDRLDIRFINRLELNKLAARNRGINPANYSPITFDDVKEWVNAPPTEGGKDKTLFEESKRMADRENDQIVHDVFRAITQHQLGVAKRDYSAITQRLEDWINHKVLKGDLDELLRLVLQSWEGAMEPILERDFTDWVDDTLNVR